MKYLFIVIWFHYIAINSVYDNQPYLYIITAGNTAGPNLKSY